MKTYANYRKATRTFRIDVALILAIVFLLSLTELSANEPICELYDEKKDVCVQYASQDDILDASLEEWYNWKDIIEDYNATN